MKTSVIRYRVADFLREHPPFEAFSLEDLLTFSGTGRVLFHEDDIYVFRKGQARDPLLWVIQQGRIEILDETPAGERLCDVLGPGDILGLARAEDAVAHPLTARTATEVILYAFDASAFETLTRKYPEAARYLTAHLSASTRHTKALQAPANRERLLTDREKASWLHAPPAPSSLLQQRLVSREPELPTAPPGLRPAEYLLTMLRNRCQALVITTDGTPGTPAEGIVTDTSLAIHCGRNPTLYQQKMLAAESVEELAYLRERAAAFLAEELAGPSGVEWFWQMQGELHAVLTERLVAIAQTGMARAGRVPPALAHCWLALGRSGRRELLAPERSALGLVYADPPAALEEEAGKYFATLAHKVEAKLKACGFHAQPHSHGVTCRTFSAWKQLYAALIQDPIGNAIYPARELFDVQFVCGDPAPASGLQETIHAELQRQEAFLPVLANDTLANLPPLTFFQGFVIESDGTRKQTLDLEKTALDPLSDAARVFALASEDCSVSNTLHRLESAARTLPQYASTFRDAADAMRIASYQHAIAAFKTEGDAVLITPARLGRFEQRLLKSAFDAIRRLLELTATIHHLSNAQ